uniref:Uncharacterized protein n=1 Tax=Cannabis sativa TaxID=3483 RepID=A0A803NID7_CANSA
MCLSSPLTVVLVSHLVEVVSKSSHLSSFFPSYFDGVILTQVIGENRFAFSFVVWIGVAIRCVSSVGGMGVRVSVAILS